MSKRQSYLLLCLLFAVSATTLFSQIPQTLSYQGVLTDPAGKPVADGAYALTFKLYSGANGGDAIWTESQTLTLTTGIFNAILGQVSPLNLAFDVPYWLGITVDTGTELTPRIELTAAAYSLNARAVADSVISGKKLARGAVVRSVNNLTDHLTLKAGPNVTITSDQHTITISATADGGNSLDQAYDQGGPGAGRTITADAGAVNIEGTGGLLVNGNVGIGTSTPTQKLEINGTAKMTGFQLPTDAANNYVLTSDASGIGTWKAIPTSATGISGSGALNYLPKFTGATSIGNSLLFENNGKIGLGTTDPLANLYINAGSDTLTHLSIYSLHGRPAFEILRDAQSWGKVAMRMFVDGSSTGIINVTNKNSGAAVGLKIQTNGIERFIVNNSGNVGIGTTEPVEKLDVAGVIRTTGFKMPTNAAENYVLTSDANGVGTWKAVTAPASGWTIAGNNLYSTVSGNVGIGTSNPQRPLHLANASNVSLVLEDLGATANARKKFINADDGLLRFGKFDDNWNFTSQMTIGDGGYIGIGTENPTRQLDVAGMVQMTGFRMPTGATNNYVLTSDVYGAGTWKPVTLPATGWTINGNNVYSSVTGNVGIGNTNPTQKLDITGTAQMTGFRMPSGATNNYVLTSDASGVGTWKASTGITGNGTANCIPKFTGTNSVGNSLIFEDSRGFIRIGTEIISTAKLSAYQYGENVYAIWAQADGRSTIGGLLMGTTSGVVGVAHSGVFWSHGVYGDATSNVGDGTVVGVFGNASGSSSSPKYGIYGTAYGSGTLYAGYFDGNARVTGTLTKGGGAFIIDHPLDPANKYLYHSFVESPDMKNIYDGVVVLDPNGEARIVLPDWFGALNRDFRYQLTAIGAPGPNLYIAEEISNNQFKIAGGQPGMKVSWLVTGIRQDAYAEKNRIQVEEIKPDRERGKYLHPEALGLSETLGIGYENRKAAESASVKE